MSRRGCPEVVSNLGQRRRRWLGFETASGFVAAARCVGLSVLIGMVGGIIPREGRLRHRLGANRPAYQLPGSNYVSGGGHSLKIWAVYLQGRAPAIRGSETRILRVFVKLFFDLFPFKTAANISDYLTLMYK